MQKEAPEQIIFEYSSASTLFALVDKLTNLDKQHNLLTSETFEDPPSQFKCHLSFKYVYLDPSGQANIIYFNTVNQKRNQEVKYEMEEYEQISKEVIQLQQIIGMNKFQKIVESEIESLQDLNGKIERNNYFDIGQILSDIKMLFNKKMLSCYSTHYLLSMQPGLFFKGKIELKTYWDYYGDYLTFMWLRFVKFLISSQIIHIFYHQRKNDYANMFSLLKEYRIETKYFQVENHIKMEDISVMVDQSLEKSKASQGTKNVSNSKPEIMTGFNQNIKKEEFKYPIIKNYVANPQVRAYEIQSILRSEKKPFLHCNENCFCLGGSIACQNISGKIECVHHNCLNSQIRCKEGLICKYLDPSKNYQVIESSSNQKQIQFNTYSVEEFISYGIDFYTYKILYLLLPFQNQQVLKYDAADKRNQFIQNVLLPDLSKTTNIIKSLQHLTLSQKWKSYATILLNKLSKLNEMVTENNKAKYQGQSEPYPNVVQIEAHCKGIGIRNTKHKLCKDRLIGQFYGEAMEPWREEEKQHILTQINEREQKKSHFYCIMMESHFNQPSGMRYLSIDPMNCGNFTRCLNHSCNPNCYVDVIISEGSYHVVFFAKGDIQPYEELTFHYMSVTDNQEEFKSSICLCGKHCCSGRYFKFQQQLFNPFSSMLMKDHYPLERKLIDLFDCCLFKINSFNAETHKIQIRKKQLFLSQQGINLRDDKSKNQWLTCWVHLLYSYIDKQYHGKDDRLQRKEKILSINSKINKVLYFLEESASFEPPLILSDQDDVLDYILQETTVKFKQNLLNKKYSKQKHLKDLRAFLIHEAQKIQNTDRNKALKMIKKAFTFILVKPRIYNTFYSPEIEIFRGKTSKIIERGPCYYGEDYHILACLLNWGEYKVTSNIESSKSKETMLFSQKIDQLCNCFQERFLKIKDPSFEKQQKIDWKSVQKQLQKMSFEYLKLKKGTMAEEKDANNKDESKQDWLE